MILGSVCLWSQIITPCRHHLSYHITKNYNLWTQSCLLKHLNILNYKSFEGCMLIGLENTLVMNFMFLTCFKNFVSTCTNFLKFVDEQKRRYLILMHHKQSNLRTSIIVKELNASINFSRCWTRPWVQEYVKLRSGTKNPNRPNLALFFLILNIRKVNYVPKYVWSNSLHTWFLYLYLKET